MKEMTIKEALQKYERMNKAERVAVGFKHKGNIYTFVMNLSDKEHFDLFAECCRFDTNKGGASVIRFKPSTANRFDLLEYGWAFVLTDSDNFETFKKQTVANNGQAFEMLTAKHYNAIDYHYDNVPFYIAPDFVCMACGFEMGIQCKYDGATVCKMSQLDR